jgi:hypothetical protein
MSLHDALRREITELASRATDGVLDAAGQARLEEILRGTPEARTFYVRFMGISAGLAWAARGGVSESLSAGVPERRAQPLPWRWMGAVAAILALAAFSAGMLLLKPARVVPPEQDSGIATLTSAAGLEWEESEEPRHNGNALLPGWIRIRTGIAQIDFISGTSVWIEGPAAFQLVSQRRGYLEAGKLVAHVPHGTPGGFQVDCALATIVDRGTAFGMEIKPGQAAVHVFTGLVEVTPKDRRPASYGAGQAVALDRAGTAHVMFSDPRLFDYGDYGWGFGSFGILGAGMGRGPHYSPGDPWDSTWESPPWNGWDSLGFIRSQLGVDAARWDKIQPTLSRYLAVQRELRSLGYVVPDSAFSRAAWSLWLGVVDTNVADEDLKQRLAAYQETREAERHQRDQVENELKEMLTVREEAKLLDLGYLR